MRSPDEATALLGGKTPVAIKGLCSSPHLDKGEPPTLKRYDIDYADRCLIALREDTMTFEAKYEREKGLR